MTDEGTTTDKGAEEGGKGDEFTPITSQDDLDRILGARLAREREKYADYADLKAAKTEYDKLLDAAKTEQERAVEAARNEGKTEALTLANTRLISAEARALAATAKFRNPNLAVKGISLDDIKVNDDGSVDADAIKARLKELSDADPYLIDDKKAPRPDASQGGGKTKTKTESLTALDGKSLYERMHPKKTA